ncbi:nose resistant to fluoxetine protein 6-like [Dermatophagoides pteronyssinus]|uniref:nose resistant to fluoxetine protein 6-like n=1 Tax=Dermatophagoides pteronyssinus TaxID=6956 RepID=UPI003F6793EF
MAQLNFLAIFMFFILNSCHYYSCNDEYLWQPLLNISDNVFTKAILPHYIDFNHDIIDNHNISQQCRMDIHRSLLAFNQRKTWSFKLFNSWARSLPSGLMIGTFTDYGDYDQCLSIDHTDIISKYCFVDLSLPMPNPMPDHHNIVKKFPVIPTTNNTNRPDLVSNGTIFYDLSHLSPLFYYIFIRMGICIPYSCSDTDIHHFIENKGIQEIGLTFHSSTCTIKSNEKWIPNLPQTAALIILTILFAITIWAAIYDRLVMKKSYSITETILLWFSPIQNAAKLISVKTSKHDDLACLHGIRFLTLVWIIIGHTLEWNPMNLFRQSFLMQSRLSSLGHQPLFKAHYSVDTFFYLSGLLTSYVTFKYTQNDYRKFRYIPYTFLRYLRLTPQLIAFMLLLSLLPPLYDGPLWSTYMNNVMDKCSLTWWHNILYLQNVIDVQNICALHTWYLAADMQLHYMSVILIGMLLRYPKRGMLVTKCLILVCICISGLTVFIQKHPPGGIVTIKNDFLDEFGRPSEFLKFFYQPWNHANVFFIGFIFGAKLHERSDWNRMVSMKTSSKLLCWLLAFSGYLFCIYSTAPWLYGRPYDPFWSAILYPLNRTIWALVLTLIIWLCITNNGLFIGNILSWKVFRPLSRMTYSVYLTHVLVFYVALGSRRNLIDMRMTAILSLLTSSIVISYLFGFIFTVLVESPLIHFLDYLKNYWLINQPLNSEETKVNNNNDNDETDEKKLNIPEYDVNERQIQLILNSESKV